MAKLIIDINDDHVQRICEAFDSDERPSNITLVNWAKTRIIQYIKDTVKYYEINQIKNSIDSQVQSITEVEVN